MSRQIVWEFRVAADKREEFERVYSAQGDWAQLFAKSVGFHSTTLLRDASLAGRYLSVDLWDSGEAFEKFQQQFAAEYKDLNQRCEALTDYEMKIGAFDTL